MNGLNVELPLDRVTAADLDGDVKRIPPGRYHVIVVAVDRAKEDKKDHLRFRYEVLSGTVSGQKGMRLSERFYLTESAIKRLVILAQRLGLINDADFGKSKPVNWAAVAGRDLVVEVVDHKYENRNGQDEISSQWSYAGFYSPEDPRVQSVPRDAAAAQARLNELIDAEARAKDSKHVNNPNEEAF